MSNRSEIEIIQAVDKALSELDDDAKKRVLAWVNAKYASDAATLTTKAAPTPPPKGGGRVTTGRKRKAKSKVAPKQIKDLNLRPKGKESVGDFADKKRPTNQMQKCVVALYYLLNVLKLDKAGLNHVFTVFKDVGWRVPANLANTLHQTGTVGWLDTADSEDLKVTGIGENLVEHDLPKAKVSQ